MAAAARKAIQLYSIGTPNGQKVSIGLEELGIAYEAVECNPFKPASDSNDPDGKLGVNRKIPAIIDPNFTNPLDGTPLTIFESGAILQHLAEQYGAGKLLPTEPAAKSIVIQWLTWQMAGLGPMFGQYFHFHRYAPEQIPYAKTRYETETKRLFKVLETQLGLTKKFVAGDYSIADIAIFPWVDAFIKRVPELGIDEATHPNITRWAKEINARPAVVKGLAVLPMTPPTTHPVASNSK